MNEVSKALIVLSECESGVESVKENWKRDSEVFFLLNRIAGDLHKAQMILRKKGGV